MVARMFAALSPRDPRHRVMLLASLVVIVVACSSTPAEPKAAGFDGATEEDAPAAHTQS